MLRLSCLPALALLFAAHAQAQLPVDNPVYKQRCALLNSQDAAIQTGTVPQILVAQTHGIPALQYETFAFERSKAGYHQVACELFYFAAIARRAGNGEAANMKAAHHAAVLGESEIHLAAGQKLTLAEHLSEGEAKAAQVKAPALTSPQLTAIVAAVSTLPLSLNPPPIPVPPAPKHR